MTQELSEFEEICGELFDHDILETGDGCWVCRRCGAEGWDEELDENHKEELE